MHTRNYYSTCQSLLSQLLPHDDAHVLDDQVLWLEPEVWSLSVCEGKKNQSKNSKQLVVHNWSQTKFHGRSLFFYFFIFGWLPDPARALEGVFFYQVSHCMAVGRPRTPAPTIAVTLWKAAYHHLAFRFPVTGSQASKAFVSAAAESGAYPLSTFSTSCSSSSSNNNDDDNNDIKFRNPQEIKKFRNKIERLDPKSQSKIHLTICPRGPPARMQEEEEEDSATLEECGNPTIKPTNTAPRWAPPPLPDTLKRETLTRE